MADSRIYDPIDSIATKGTPTYEQDQNMSAYLRNIILNVNEIQSVCIISNDGDYISADNNMTKIGIKNIIPPESALLTKMIRFLNEGKSR